MTMYLPNRDLRPTGYEAGEFIDPDEPAVALASEAEEEATAPVRHPVAPDTRP
jgi:hypothetical protein